MITGTLACTAFALLALNAQPQPSTAEAVQLVWKLEAGTSYHIESEAMTETETTTAGLAQEESQVVRSLHRVFIEEVTEEGNMLLTVTLDKFSMTKESAVVKIEIDAVRDEAGEVTVHTSLESSMPELESVEMQEFFETVGMNNMELEFMFLITPAGHVLESSIEGDPMGDLPTETEITKMVAQTASAMIVVEDLPGILAASIFIQLPTVEMEEGGEWESRVECIVAGIEMDGTGACTLKSLEQEDSTTVADISIEMDYEFGVAKLETMLENMGGGTSFDVYMTAEDTSVEMNAEFDVTSGFMRSLKFSDMLMTVEGSIAVGDTEVDLEVESSSYGYAKWSRIEDEESDE